MKFLKYLLLIFVGIPLLIAVGAVVNYNLRINRYINQGSSSATEITAPAPERTQVYVLGTVHFETDRIRRDDVYEQLESLAPSLILFEGDAQSVAAMAHRTDYVSQLKKSFKDHNEVESLVALKYLDRHPESEIGAYEWEERDAFHAEHAYLSKSSKLLSAILNLEGDPEISEQDKQTLASFSVANSNYSALSRSDLRTLNSRESDSTIAHRQAFVYEYLPELAAEHPDFQDDLSFIKVHESYWRTRNDAMVQNIMQHIQAHPNERIVVITGYTHRYYLIQALRQRQDQASFEVL